MRGFQRERRQPERTRDIDRNRKTPERSRDTDRNREKPERSISVFRRETEKIKRFPERKKAAGEDKRH